MLGADLSTGIIILETISPEKAVGGVIKERLCLFTLPKSVE
jgi:hypothetical protein